MLGQEESALADVMLVVMLVEMWIHLRGHGKMSARATQGKPSSTPGRRVCWLGVLPGDTCKCQCVCVGRQIRSVKPLRQQVTVQHVGHFSFPFYAFMYFLDIFAVSIY